MLPQNFCIKVYKKVWRWKLGIRKKNPSEVFLFSQPQVYMPGFLSSNLYYKYLSDLINSVRVDEFTGGNANTPSQGWTPEVDRNSSVTEGSQVIDWFDGLPKSYIALVFHNNIRILQEYGCKYGLIFSKCFHLQLQQGTKKAAVKILKNFDEAITVDIASLDPESLYQRPYAGWVRGWNLHATLPSHHGTSDWYNINIFDVQQKGWFKAITTLNIHWSWICF